jgi:hypothetical protein
MIISPVFERASSFEPGAVGVLSKCFRTKYGTLASGRVAGTSNKLRKRSSKGARSISGKIQDKRRNP